jgi:glycosyltransferase involved in cell wall biosynthesis
MTAPIENGHPRGQHAIPNITSDSTNRTADISAPPWVIVSAGFHFTAGQAKAVAGLADYLARNGTAVHLVGSAFDAGLAARPEVTTHHVPTVRGADVIGNMFLAAAGWAVARRVTRRWPDARVVVNGGNCIWADINWVHYVHHAFMPDLVAAPRWFRAKEWVVTAWDRRRERRALGMARLVVTNSRRTTTDVTQRLGVSADRVRTVYYGADPSWSPATADERRRGCELFNLHPDRPVVAFVGGFGYDNRKGFDTLIEAWRRLCQDPAWDADLVMAGGGRATAAVTAQIARDGLTDRVRMVGFTNRVYDLLAASDLLVSPVRYEPYGLNVQEAICRGVPALVSAVAGVAEEYPPDLAEMLLPNADNAADLAARLRQWRGDIPKWRERFRPLSDRLRSRSWDDMAQEIVAAAAESAPSRRVRQ